MTQALSRDEHSLNYSLKSLLADYGYQRVLDRLVRVARSAPTETDVWMPTLDYLLALTPEERAPFLSAAVEDALPLYEADLARPPAERDLTADLETGEFYDHETGVEETGVEEKRDG